VYLLLPVDSRQYRLAQLMHRFAVFLLSRINEEFRDVKLADLRILATLGVGGFGRVELVQIAGDPTRSFALKQMKKSQVWSRKAITASRHS
jgi:hypothetical protein